MLLLAPGFAADPPKLALAVLLARIALPFLLCMSLVALYSGVLNALGRFAVAAFAPSLLNVVLIAVLVALIAIGDVEQSTAAVALAWGIAASGVLQVIVVAIAAAKSKMRLSFRLPRFDADMRRLLVLAAPALHRRRHESAHRHPQHHHRIASGPRGVLALLRRPAVSASAWRHRRCRRRGAAA